MPIDNYPTKVLQFGGGNFLRAFSNWMIDILNQEEHFNSSVTIVKPTPQGDYTELRNQNGIYHILTKGIKDGVTISDSHQVTSINEVIHPYNNWFRFLESAESPSIRYIISNTTESGIKYSEEELIKDVCPNEFPAKLTRWLYHRWLHFDGATDKGCIFLPCELIENNGTELKDCIIQYIKYWKLEAAFRKWILQSNHFCNTLVDRIVPGKPINTSQDELLLNDKLLVMAEPYHLWAIKASEEVRKEFSVENSSLNIVYANDLTPFRKLKVRILNGAHTAMVPLGILKGIPTVREVIESKELGTYIQELLHQEILPTIDFPREKIETYIETTLDRFRNPFIDHQLQSISLNSISKFRYRLLPSLLDYVDKFNKIPDRISTSFAALIVFYLGGNGSISTTRNESSETLSFFDNLQQERESGKEMSDVVTLVLSNQDFWGQDLNQIHGLQPILITKVMRLIS